MKFKAQVMDEMQVRRAVIRMSHEIIEHNRGVENVLLIGIQRRGLPIAKEIASVIRAVEGKDIPVGAIDITLYRDDFSQLTDLPQIKDTHLPFSIENANIILVDDVLYTGRTTRAALEVLTQAGRPKTVQLAVLVDRGYRELPIGANYVGKSVPSLRDELVSVSVPEIDGKSCVEIYII
ncbi:MAG: bifunctional pyr operon transcriptional regulator/uracil phosphoribosyltransferase PyrR [Firmicutes bacterium]|nr:bifunctional pyr operon transcriptional regulator/uracil phosphoribosyltransferase PyrR [Bacillota bacterium]